MKLELSPQIKASARQKAQIYRRKGILQTSVCAHCEESMADEMHHPDYSQPLLVKFLCRECHLIQTAYDRMKRKETVKQEYVKAA